jgi:hypothetical protein
MNFPIASASGLVDCVVSPLYAKVVKQVAVENAWVLLYYKGYVYLRDLGWVKQSDVKINALLSRLWLRLLKRIIPKCMMHIWHSRNNLEKGTAEYVVTCLR